MYVYAGERVPFKLGNVWGEVTDLVQCVLSLEPINLSVTAFSTAVPAVDCHCPLVTMACSLFGVPVALPGGCAACPPAHDSAAAL